jgi:effector-binding domain-containing protein
MTMQDLPVSVERVEERQLATIRTGCTELAELGGIIMAALNQIWPFLREHDVSTGHNVVVYRDSLDIIDIGVEVFEPLPPHDRIVSTTTPSGMAATVAHFGPYAGLPRVHAALQTWSLDNDRPFVPPCWELYGDWSDDPDEVRTDVYYLLPGDNV